MWLAQQTYFGAQVLPVDDLIEHDHDETSDTCVCGPRQEHYPNGRVDVHASLDGRELRERACRS